MLFRSEYLAKVLDLLLGLTFAFAGYKFTLFAFTTGQSTITLGIPEWPFHAIWIICAVLIAVFSFVSMLQIPVKYQQTTNQ